MTSAARSFTPPPLPTAEVEEQIEASYAVLGNGPDFPSAAVEDARRRGITLRRVDVPQRLPLINQFLRSRPIAFLLGHVGDRGLVDGARVLSGYFPPLVAVHDDPIDPEPARLAGVSALISSTSTPEVWAEVCSRFASSGSWARLPIGRMDVAGAIQSFSDVQETVCLSVACPHAAPLSRSAWHELGSCGGRTCTGWYGRVYLSEGRVLSAEIPGDDGIQALARILNMRSGQVLCHESFIPPEHTNLGLRVHAALLEAATCSDHQSVGREYHQGAQPTDFVEESEEEELEELDEVEELRTVEEPMETAAKPQQSLGEALVQSRGGIHGVAVCDRQGWVESTAGEIDGETVCAVVTMSAPQIRRAAQLLGLGTLRQWAVSSKRTTIYATEAKDGMIAATGDAAPNLDTGLRLIRQAQAAR